MKIHGINNRKKLLVYLHLCNSHILEYTVKIHYFSTHKTPTCTGLLDSTVTDVKFLQVTACYCSYILGCTTNQRGIPFGCLLHLLIFTTFNIHN